MDNNITVLLKTVYHSEQISQAVERFKQYAMSSREIDVRVSTGFLYNILLEYNHLS